MDFKKIESDIKNKFDANNIWVPIYQNNFKEEESTISWFLTFSENKEKELETVYWSELFDTNYARRIGEMGGPKYFLVIKRSGNKYLNDVEIAEDFRLFFNLYEKNKEYYTGDYEVEPEKVIRFTEKTGLYEVKYSYLLKYISYKKIYAILNFELDFYHDRMCKDKVFKTQSLYFDKKSYSTPNYKYQNKFNVLTRYMGKTILDFVEIKNLDKNVSTKFLIGLSKTGKAKFVTIKDWNASKECDVCFDRKVLLKYYEKPEIFNVSYSNVKCGNYWILDGFNKESFNEIVVSTHNLINLPLKEREYWSRYAKLPEDTNYKTLEIHTTSELISLVNNFKYYWNQKNPSVQFFKSLSEDNKYKINQIYVPLGLEKSEFFKIIENICVCFIETIDKALLRANTPEKFISVDENGFPKNGTRIAIKDFLESYGIENNEFDKFLKNLIAIRDNSSHPKSSDYKNAKEYFKLDKIGTQQCIINISNKLIELIKTLSICFGISLR